MNSVVRTRSFCASFPGLTSWAKFVRPCGAGQDQSSNQCQNGRTISAVPLATTENPRPSTSSIASPKISNTNSTRSNIDPQLWRTPMPAPHNQSRGCPTLPAFFAGGWDHGCAGRTRMSDPHSTFTSSRRSLAAASREAWAFYPRSPAPSRAGRSCSCRKGIRTGPVLARPFWRSRR